VRLPSGREVLDWFPFHAIAWDQDEWVRTMTPEARGCYVTLLVRQWIDGSLPDDRSALRALAGWNVAEEMFRDKGDGDRSYTWEYVWTEIEGHFAKHPKLPERLINRTLERIRREQMAGLRARRRQTAKATSSRLRNGQRNGHATSGEVE